MKATMSGWSKEEEQGRRRGSPEGSRKIMRVQKQKIGGQLCQMLLRLGKIKVLHSKDIRVFNRALRADLSG